MSFEIIPPARYGKSSQQCVVRSFGGGEWFFWTRDTWTRHEVLDLVTRPQKIVLDESRSY